MRVSDAFPSRYVKSEDLAGRAAQVIIAHVSFEEVGGQGKTESKPILYFVGKTKGMVLNKTNAESIAIVLGEEMDAWAGHKLELFTMRVQGPNGMVDGIRCRVILPPGATAAPRTAARELPHPGIAAPAPDPLGTTDEFGDDSLF